MLAPWSVAQMDNSKAGYLAAKEHMKARQLALEMVLRTAGSTGVSEQLMELMLAHHWARGLVCGWAYH
jgi:hypothetical protein